MEAKQGFLIVGVKHTIMFIKGYKGDDMMK